MPNQDTEQEQLNALNVEEAAKIVAADKQARERACMSEINEVVARHHCRLMPVVKIGDQWVTLTSVLKSPFQILTVSN